MGRLRRHARSVAVRFRSEFRRSLDDPNAPLSLDMGPDSRTLLIAFGGMRGMMGNILPFEFFKATGTVAVKRLFVRDLRQAWYHRGVPGHGSSIEAVGHSLGELVAAQGVERLVMVGNSAGGYAALLFGTLLGADSVLCFAPQTVLELEVLAEMDDHRWDDQLRELTHSGDLDPRWTDLRRALPDIRRAGTRYEIYFDDSFRIDRLHAERLGGLEGAQLHRFSGGAHGIAREMRESGELDTVLQRAVGPRAS